MTMIFSTLISDQEFGPRFEYNKPTKYVMRLILSFYILYKI